MDVREHILPEVVDRILGSKTPSALLDAMKRELHHVGVEYFCLFRFAPSGEHLDKWVIGERAAQRWLDRYLYKDDPSADPIMQHCRQVIEPFFAYDIMDKERLGRAKSFSLPESLIVPVPGPHGNVGVIWAAGPSRAKLKKFSIVTQAIGFACYYHLERRYGPSPPPPQRLTAREQEVLSLVAQGLSSPEIGRMLRLSERTVEWHAMQAMKKLGAKNRIQAVVLAIRDGLIAP